MEIHTGVYYLEPERTVEMAERMREVELYEICKCASGREGFVSICKALKRFFDCGEYRNEFLISYGAVRYALDDLCFYPEDVGAPHKRDESPQYTQEDVDLLFPPLLELAASITKWADDEKPYEVDITNEPVNRAILHIEEKFLDKKGNFDRQIIQELFFPADPDHEGKFWYNGDIFYELYHITPDYDELLDPASMTERSKASAFNKYEESLSPLRNVFRYGFKDPIRWIKDEIARMLKDVESGYISKNDVAHENHYLIDGLPVALKLKTYIAYDDFALHDDYNEGDYEYGPDNGVPAHNHIVEPTPESKSQVELKELFVRYLLAGAALANRIGSTAYQHWTEAYLFYTRDQFDNCINSLKSAIPTTYADIVVRHFQKEKKIVEHAPRDMRYNDEEYANVYYLAESFLENTTETLNAVLTNTPTDGQTIDRFDRSELLIMPNIQSMIGVFQTPYMSEIERAEKLLQKSTGKSLSILDNLNKIPSIWDDFFKKLRTMATSQEHLSVIAHAQSTMRSTTRLYSLKINGIDKNTISAESVNAECEKFLAALPKLSAFIASLKNKVYDPNEPLPDDSRVLKVSLTSNPQLEKISETLKDIAIQNRPRAEGRDDIITLVRDIRGAKIKGVTSYPKATEYVRRIAEPSDKRFYKRCAWAREYARTHAKKTKTGQDKFWASIAQDAKPSAATQRAKAKRSGAPGIVPTLCN